jgi:Ca2+:H+ antiporter
MKISERLPVWARAIPVLAWLTLGIASVSDSQWLALLLVPALFAGVTCAVYHAEVVAHKIGEPFGTLLLAVAVTLIEVALIVSLMIAGGESASGLARDTVFAAIMVILSGIIGACLLLGGLRHREQSFGLHGASTSLATLAALAILTLVLPNFTSTVPGRSTANRSWHLSHWCRWSYTAPLFWCRPCATEITSYRQMLRRTKPFMRRVRVPAWHGPVWHY